jgi:hypothetical protein
VIVVGDLETDYQDCKPYYLKETQWIAHEEDTYHDMLMGWANGCNSLPLANNFQMPRTEISFDVSWYDRLGNTEWQTVRQYVTTEHLEVIPYSGKSNYGNYPNMTEYITTYSHERPVWNRVWSHSSGGYSAAYGALNAIGGGRLSPKNHHAYARLIIWEDIEGQLTGNTLLEVVLPHAASSFRAACENSGSNIWQTDGVTGHATFYALQAETEWIPYNSSSMEWYNGSARAVKYTTRVIVLEGDHRMMDTPPPHSQYNPYQVARWSGCYLPRSVPTQ